MLNMENLSNLECIECFDEEAAYIAGELQKFSSEDSNIYKEEILLDGMKMVYLQSAKKLLQRKEEIERNFNQNLLSNNKENRIQKVKGMEYLYRMETDDFYSSIIIYTQKEEEIIIKKRLNSFVLRTTEIENELDGIGTAYPKILTTTESIEYIIKNQCSLVRYGDGELNLCLGQGIGFQSHSKELQSRLIEILKHDSDNRILVTLPEFNSMHNNINNCCGQLTFWENYWIKMYKKLSGLFLYSYYGNTDVSRNSVFYENSIKAIQKIWDKREVVFVFGDKGRFEIKLELFGNIISHKSILVPPVNAFDKYPEILELCLRESKDKLFLISAGPTATVLAFDLMKQGYQALDIGHLPNCYDQYLGIIKFPESIPFIRA